MKKTIKNLLTVLTIAICTSGCFTTKKHDLNITAAYPFEGRYDSGDEISINGNKTTLKEKDSIWILSNVTLYNLLTSVSDDPNKIVFKNSRGTFSENFLTDEVIVHPKDVFDDEEYIWENWNVTTNQVK